MLVYQRVCSNWPSSGLVIVIPPSTPHVIYLCRWVGSLRSPQVGLVKRCQKYSNLQIDRQARNLKLMNEYNLFHIKLPISHILVGFYPPASPSKIAICYRFWRANIPTLPSFYMANLRYPTQRTTILFLLQVYISIYNKRSVAITNYSPKLQYTLVPSLMYNIIIIQNRKLPVRLPSSKLTKQFYRWPNQKLRWFTHIKMKSSLIFHLAKHFHIIYNI